ncbi:MAG: tetratricopeptide repeat protein [Candidatus Aminicenantes bacterium]|nr:tetratricopeptide repeat protein [Candidatus Aminicenantes bacterium]
MKKKRLSSLLVFVPLLLILSGCAPMMTNSQMQFGIQAAQKELWNEAIFRWEKVLEINPESGAAYNNLAVAYERNGEWDNAGKAYEAAMKFAPKNKYIQANYEKFKTRREAPEKKESNTETIKK